MVRQRRGHQQRAREANQVLEATLGRLGVRNPRDSIGRVRHLSDGLSYSVYCARCRTSTDRERDLVVRLPHRDAPAELQNIHELNLLAGFYAQDVATYGLGSPAAEQACDRFLSLLRRVQQKATDRSH